MSPTSDHTSRNPAGQDSRHLKSTFFVSNVHCSSCIAYITEVLSELSGVLGVDVTILTHEVRVSHAEETSPSTLAQALIQAAFEVHHVTTCDEKGMVVSDISTTSWLSKDSVPFATQQASYSGCSTQNRHLANCDACRKEERQGISELQDLSETAPTWSRNEKDSQLFGLSDEVSEIESLVPRNYAENSKSLQPHDSDGRFNARISIEGMSCASCVNTVTNEVEQLDFIVDITVNLLSNSATVLYNGPQSNIEKVIEHIEDIGFEASLDEVQQVGVTSSQSRSLSSYVAEIAISGMTCGSCAGSVTRGLEELPFVTKVSVNLLSHSGKVEFDGHDHIDDIVEKIEDLGYDASVTSVLPQVGESQDGDEIERRTVAIRVEGMFCHHCPEKVLNSLKELSGVELDDTLSVKNPIVKVTYTPRPPSLTIRAILQRIDEVHDAFKATVYHPPSIEDRSRAIRLYERLFMSLVSSNNPTRKYLEQPMWAGSVSRMEWSLFIMTTPVMFYGTDLFHVRAAKEIYSLWRPGSRVPILRRFYRFGSMNLLISAGTTVAYIASLAVLIIDAVVGTSSMNNSTTYFDSVVFLTLFILAGRYIEAYSKARTGDAVASLGKLKPSEALLIVNKRAAEQNDAGASSGENEIQRINIELLDVGDIVSIPHGASPPADGVVVDTNTYQFDESSLTGESRPVKKSAGDPIYTGSVNVGQPLKIKVSAVGGTSMLDQIIAVVREGQSRRAPLERVADLLTSHFVPIITLIAVLTFVIWLVLGVSGTLPDDYLDVAHGGWAFWSLEFAIAVFVVACPCGLALAAPTALFVGGGLAAQHGILVKGGGEAFQEASRLDAIVFDKTGTLTEGGSLTVSDHKLLVTGSEELQVAWSLARKLEESSNHPIAHAVSAFCSGKESASILSSDIEERPGQGMRGRFTVSLEDKADKSNRTAQYEAAIGNQRLLQSLTLPRLDGSQLSMLLSTYQTSGKSTTILSLRKVGPGSSNDSHFTPAIIFAISDSIRPDAAQVISQLQKRKVDVYMCTGDNQTTAHAVADMVGIPRSNVMANIMPAGKADFVRQVQDGVYPPRTDSEAESQRNEQGTRSIVAFVGDGVNDSPALAAADVSIAMASGSDVAMNSASFILLNSELDTILQLVVLSRRVFNRVKMNFGWAVVYNLCLVPVAAGVFYPIVNGYEMKVIGAETVMADKHWRLSPVWAALAMALSSISVVCSSLALGIEKKTIKKLLGLDK
ncbi:E1-E2 ATPase-domain-containing protein [Aspergillus pseudocaelatus]|uniref:E1-E2 ATPase-domain-containing protein n=1 Tax=Aspergillus pseudocaelatus TaxID=1825620 RepID=A0ABQ6WNX2_9EURO|nr:E1-E2 ATPase-domain-containing protein [Aspergillus pseudocaelatus]